MERYTLGWDQKRRDPSAVPVFAYMLTTDMGSRIWTRGIIPSHIFAGLGVTFDADVDYDAEVYFDAGSGLLEILPRILSSSPISQRTVPLGTNLLTAFGEGERQSFSVTVANEDGKLSQMLADEYVLNKVGSVFLTFAGTGVNDYITKYTGRVVRWRLEGTRRLTLDHLES